MVEVTQADRDAAKIWRDALQAADKADWAYADCECCAEERERAAVEVINQALSAHRLAAEARVVAWLRSEAQSCDCFARSEGECACGAWSDYKTMNVEQLADALARREHAVKNNQILISLSDKPQLRKDS